MELNVKVTIELPAWCEKLATNLLEGAQFTDSKPASQAPAKPAEAPTKPAEAPAPEAAAPEAPTKPAAAPKKRLGLQKPAAKPAEAPAPEAAAPEAPAESTHTLEQLRELLKAKSEGNINTIKAKLTEFGAVSLSKLDPEFYDAMYAFLESLEVVA
mgnify:CR=1 FL=1